MSREVKANDQCAVDRAQWQTTFSPRVDVVETEDAVTLFADLPGVKADELEIRYVQGELHLYGKVAPRTFPGQQVWREYGVGDFLTFTLGQDLDVEKISAQLKDGVLTLNLPRADRVKPRRIAVQGS